MLRKTTLTFGVLLFSAVIAFAQNAGLRIDPPSPTSSSLGKYGDIPVSLYTGTPNITIPLYEVKSRKLSIPISLSYHASGVKVEEIPGWVGLGWSLNAGGVITRTVRGIPDDNIVGYLYTAGDLFDIWPDLNLGDPLTIDAQNYLEDALDEGMDPEPDNFFFNFSGRSGKVIMDATNNDSIRTIPAQKMHFDLTTDTINIGTVQGVDVIEGWTIKTEDGTTYIFGKITAQDEKDYETTENNSGAGSFNPTSRAFISSWYLKKIISSEGDDFIEFFYTDPVQVTHKYHNYKEKFRMYSAGCSWNEVNSFTETITESIRLEKITTPTETIEFTSTTLRDDAVSPTGAKQEYLLDEIVVKSNAGVVKRKFVFEFSYFNPSSTDGLKKRLKLDSLIVEGSDGTEFPSYKFSYNDSQVLPSRLSGAIDHWGYFNGQTTNGEGDDANLVPYFFDEDPINPGEYEYLSGADRDPYSTYLYAGILEEITYPTGGRTKFYYEPHDYGKIVIGLVEYKLSEFMDESVTAPPGEGVESDAFVLNAPGTEKVLANFDIDVFGFDGSCDRSNNACTGSTLGLCAGVQLRDENHNQVTKFDTTGEWTLSLDPGTYYLYAETAPPESNGDCDYFATGKITWRDKIAAKSDVAGGLRIQKIEHYDEIDNQNPIVREYQYEMSSDPGRSSGVLVSKPLYHYIQLSEVTCSFLARSSTTKTPLGSTQGSHVGYKEVTVLFGSGGSNGKSVHNFFAPDNANKRDENIIDDSDFAEEYWPIRTRTSKDWKRGLQTERNDYNASGTNLLKEENDYNFDDEQPEEAYLNTKRFKAVGVKKSQEDVNGNASIYFKKYEVYSSWYYQTQSEITSFDGSPTNPVVTTTGFVYNDPNHLQLTKSTETNTDGAQRITEFKYAHQASGSTGMAADSVHMFSQLYSTTIREKPTAGDTTEVAKNWTKWAYDSGDDVWRPEEEWVWKSTAASAPTDPSTGNPETIKTTTYQDYDQYGNLLKILDANDVETTYTWEQNNSLVDTITDRPDATTTLVTNYNYDANTLQLTEIIDPNNRKTKFEYDAFQRLVTTKDAGANTVSSISYVFSRVGANPFDPDHPNYIEEKLYRTASDFTTTTTYFDGLGRNIQTQVKDGVNDIVQHFTYDNQGRADLVYKAFEHNTSHQFLPVNQFPANPLVEDTDYEANPLNRISRVDPFGGATTKDLDFVYGAETFSGSLFRFVETTDENDIKRKEYFDKFDNQVAVISAVGKADEATTEFTYDVLGNLEETEDPTDKITQYAYNTLSQLIAKAAPDLDGDGNGDPTNETASGGPGPDIRFKYDSRGNLRFEQDANLRQGGDDLIFYQYDGINRQTVVGVAKSDATIPSWSNLDPDVIYDGPSGENFENQTVHPGNLRTSNFYDGEPPYGSGAWADASDHGVFNNLSGRLAATAYRNDGAHDWSYTFYSYDNNGNIEWMEHQIDGLEKKIEYEYDFAGNITKVIYNRTGSGYKFYIWYDYNERGLLAEVFTNTSDSKSGLAAASYDYWPTGVVKSLGLDENSGQSYTETQNYFYNERDWLRGINAENGIDDINPGSPGTLFAMHLNYFSGSGAPQYNGNISDAAYFTRRPDSGGGPQGTNFHKYVFDYDDLNRLQDADFYYATDPANFLSSQSYDVLSISYDRSGNISGLTRRDESGAGSALTYNYRTGSNMLDWVQNLNSQSAGNYGYDNNGNIILDQAKELVDIQYDHRNMPLEIESELPDQLDLMDESITATKIYRAQNNINAESFTVTSTGNVTFAAGMEIRLKPGFSTETGSIFRADVDPDLVDATTTIKNRYDDSGSRVEKELETGPKFTYIRDLNGQTLAVLDENGTELFYNIYGLDLIGQYDVAAGEEFYHLKDHLGNIRVTIDDNWNVLAYDDYYPFGLQMTGRVYNSGFENDIYKYSSKELDEETGLNWYYFGARLYDPEVGKWYVPDPLEDVTPGWTPYSYVFDNPIRFTDFWGLMADTLGIQIPIPLPAVVVEAPRYEPSNYDPLALLSWWIFENRNYYEVLWKEEVVLPAVAAMTTAMVPIRGIRGIKLGKGQLLRNATGKFLIGGIIRNKPLKTLTHNQIYNAILETGWKPRGHFIKMLRDPRTQQLGVNTLADLERIMTKGVVTDAYSGAKQASLSRLKIIFSPSTKHLITIRPL